MKTLKLLSVLVLAILTACGEKHSELNQKKENLKELKQQLGDLKSQISALEKEIELSDTLTEGGIHVKVRELKSTAFVHYIDQPGTVSSKENVVVSSEMGGMVVQRLVEEGNWVSKGQAIIQLDASILANQVEDLRQSSDLAQTTMNAKITYGNKVLVRKCSFYRLKNQYFSLAEKISSNGSSAR